MRRGSPVRAAAPFSVKFDKFCALPAAFENRKNEPKKELNRHYVCR